MDNFVSVTQCLSVISNYDSIPEHILEPAAALGKEVHGHCLSYAEGLPSIVKSPEALDYFERFQEWFDENVAEVLATEELLTDRELMLKGHVDMICRFKKQRRFDICDIKRVAVLQQTTGLQLAAYKHLADKKFKRKFGRRLALWLPKHDSPLEVVPFADKRDWSMFLCAYSLKNYLNK